MAARRRFRLGMVALGVLGLPGCSVLDRDGTPVALAADEVVFLAQATRPDAVMEALFDGRVLLDDRGCLRLDAPGEAATVVWPYRFTLSPSLEVRDAAGRTVGKVGERFRMGGGFVPSLHPGIPLLPALRDLAGSRCPGSYWIVGDL